MVIYNNRCQKFWYMNNRWSLIISRRNDQHRDRGTVNPSNVALLNASCIRQTACLRSWALERPLFHFWRSKVGRAKVDSSFPSTHTCCAWNGQLIPLKKEIIHSIHLLCTPIWDNPFHFFLSDFQKCDSLSLFGIFLSSIIFLHTIGHRMLGNWSEFSEWNILMVGSGKENKILPVKTSLQIYLLSFTTSVSWNQHC